MKTQTIKDLATMTALGILYGLIMAYSVINY
jgi:hypothetical protein